MQNLRLFVATALLAVLTIQVQAQGLGIRGGVNFQNINGKDALGDQLENDIVAGYHLGVIAEAELVPTFYFQSGLLYSVKGTKSTDDFLGQSITSTVKTGYLEVPLHFMFKPALGNGHLILGFGPYVAFGLNGKAKIETGGKNADWDVSFQRTVSASDNDETYYQKRFDAGGNLFFGYEFAGGLSVQLNTQLGMIKINPDYEGFDDKSKYFNTGFGLSAMYRIGPK
ncbi:MAG: outer membrane beta-barrel protein [Bacteroidetes bacterium]|nr:outer membrane beta-barrel protein [Bacteroidota bacterium]